MNLKHLYEELESKKAEVRAIAELCVKETRDMSEDERTKFEGLTNEIRNLEDTIKKFEDLEENEEKEERKMDNENKLTVEQKEERAFENYIMGKTQEMRVGEQNFDIDNNGAVVPTTIANRIIKAVEERCPIFSQSTRYSVKGDLRIPVYGAEGEHNITVGYTADFAGLTGDANKFTSINLSGYLVGALALVGKRLQTNAQFDVVAFVVNEIADKMALFIENEMLNGSGDDAIEGILTGAENVVTADALSFDALIDAQSAIPTVYQTDAVWTMSPKTLTAIRKIKDKNDRYLMQNNVENGFPWTLLGKGIYITDAMPEGKIIYGDYKGMACNVRENISVEVLREAYAALHALAVVCYAELDAKIQNHQMLAVLKIG